MEYKDFIKAGERVVYMPNWSELSWWCDFENCIVKISEYPVYYTNGDADPKPEFYDSACMVEAVPESKSVDEFQFRLRDLHPIQKEEKDVSVIFDGRRCKLIGKVLGYDCDLWEWVENGYAVIENRDKEWKVIDEDDYEIENTIDELSFEELKELRGEICLGSDYIHHYNNSFGVDANDLCELCDDFWHHLCDVYGEENAEEHDTPEEFADYCYGIEVA